MSDDEIVVDLRDSPVTDPDSMGEHESIVAALDSHYRRQGHDPHELWVGDLPTGTTGMFDLAVPDLHRLIDVVTNDTLISLDPHRYSEWRENGYEIWVFAPADQIRVVERRLRGNVDHIQPWSLDGPKVILGEPNPAD